jgi:hypothetical protein
LIGWLIKTGDKNKNGKIEKKKKSSKNGDT